MNNTPLYDALLKYNNKNMSSFHTPGHKGNFQKIKKTLLELDYTELPDTDNLFDPSGAILAAQRNAANIFKVKKTLFSVGGCTLCIQAMIHRCVPLNGKIICSRVIHKSAINTIALLGLHPIWIYPKPNANVPSIPGAVTKYDVEKALKLNPDTSAVYLTSPNYYGVISDIKAISDICNFYNIPLIIDNAHGAHLMYVGGDLHPIHQGASMTACSAHKTLPVLTGGAWLNINNEKYIEDTIDSMALFGSTSPSYPIMASLDLCCNWLNIFGMDAFKKLEQRVDKIKIIALEKGMYLPEENCDPVRITLDTASIGITGFEAAEFMRSYGVEPEYSDFRHVILIPSPFNSEEDFIKLENSIKSLRVANKIQNITTEFDVPDMKMLPRDAMMRSFEKIKVIDAENRIAAESPCVCPPGMPVVMAGEVINKKIINMLLDYRIYFIKVIK